MPSDFIEYVESICTTASSIIVCVCFATIILRRAKVFKLIGNIEKLINTSEKISRSIIGDDQITHLTFKLKSGCKYRKSEAFFFKTNQQVERLSEVVFTLLVKIALQCLMLPKCIVSFGTYFATDSGNDSFELPVPLW